MRKSYVQKSPDSSTPPSFFTEKQGRGRTGLALMRLVQRWRVSLLPKGLLPVRSSRLLSPSATTLWAGSALWAFSQRCAGEPWREEATRLLSRSLALCSGRCRSASSIKLLPKRRPAPRKNAPISPRMCSPQRLRSAPTRGSTSRSTCPSRLDRFGPCSFHEDPTNLIGGAESDLTRARLGDGRRSRKRNVNSCRPRREVP